MSTIYVQKHSETLCGIAVILMFMHHIWGFPQMRLDDVSLVFFFDHQGVSLERLLASFGKICVAIFAFNTGFVMYKFPEKYGTFRHRLERIIKFWISYAIVAFLFILYGFFVNEPLPSIGVFLLNLIGFGFSRDFVCIPFAWYVSVYIIAVFIYPIFKIFKYNLVSDVSIAYGMLILISISAHLTHWKLLENMQFLGLFWSGYLSSKFHILEGIYSHISSRISYFILALLIVVRAGFVYLGNYNYFFDPFFVVILIAIIIKIIESLQISIAWLRLLGINSMNLWFLHGVFFMSSRKLQYVLYYPKYSILVLIWAFLLLLPLAYIITKLQNKLNIYIFSYAQSTKA